MQSEPAVEWVAIADLFGNPANPRHNDEAAGTVADSIRRFGWQQPVVAKPSGEVIAGNTRLEAARRLGLERVPAVRFTGSDLEATAYSIADNRTHDFATFDEVALAKLLEALRAEDALEGVGYSDAEVSALIAAALAEELSGLEDPGTGEPPEFPVLEGQDVLQGSLRPNTLDPARARGPTSSTTRAVPTLRRNIWSSVGTVRTRPVAITSPSRLMVQVEHQRSPTSTPIVRAGTDSTVASMGSLLSKGHEGRV